MTVRCVAGEVAKVAGRVVLVGCINERHLGDARSSARAPPYRILKKSGSDCLLLYLFFLCAFPVFCFLLRHELRQFRQQFLI